MKKNQRLTEKINCATEGLIYAFKTEKVFKIHISIALVTLLLCLWLDLDKIDLLFICFAITLVLVAETFNTSIEALVNLLTLSHHPLAKIAKDVAAGTVLITCINSLIVAYVTIFQAFKKPFFSDVFSKIGKQPTHGIVIMILLILFIVLVIKSIGGRGTFTRGGLVSGHAALAFAASTTILCITKNVLATSIAFMLAVLVAQSRIEAKFHRWFEVILGALIGIFSSLLIFYFLYRF